MFSPAFCFRPVLFLALIVLLGARPASAVLLDGGVDPYNLGKGDWIWVLSNCRTALGVATDNEVLDYEKAKGVQWVTVKCGDGGSFGGTWSQFDLNLVNYAHSIGLKIFGWAYARGTNVIGEINVVSNAMFLGADGVIIDAESQYETDTNPYGHANAIKYCQAIRKLYPNRFLAHGPSPSVHFHPGFPYVDFGMYCDTVMPQDYWGYRNITPAQMLAMMEDEYRTNLNNQWVGSATNAIKPLAPVAQADVSDIPGSEESDFVYLLRNAATPLTPGGYHGVSFWDCQEHSASQWMAIGATNVLLMTTNPPAIPFPPINRSVEVGSNATFVVRASGAPTLAYQWRFNGAAIANATNSTYTISSSQTTNAGSYSVVVTNPFGTLTSAVAKLTVNVPLPALQQVFADNFDTNSATLWNLFQGSANGTSDFATNWAFDYSTQMFSLCLAGYTTTTQAIPVAPSTGDSTRRGLKLTVNKNDATASQSGVSLYPKGLSAMSNVVLRFDAWINYAGGPFGALASGTTEMLTCGLNHTGTRVNWMDVNSSSSDGTWFTVDGEGGSGSRHVQSYSAGTDYRAYQGNGASTPTHLSVGNSGLTASGAVSEDCIDLVYGNLFSYPNCETPGVPGKSWVQVELSQRSKVLTWRMNGVVVAQRTNTSAFTNGNAMIGYLDPFSSISNPKEDNYLIVDNVRVYTFVESPVIIAQPASLSVSLGSNAVFTVVAAGASPLNYQWRFNSADVSGATASAFTRTNAQFSDAGNYSVVISNSLGSVTSSVATLTVLQPALFQDDFDSYVSPSIVTSAATTNGFKIFFASTTNILDFKAIFGFDYSTVTYPTNIPPAPNSSGGSTKGLYLTVNKDTTAAIAAVNFYPSSQSFTGNFALKFDMWINWANTSNTTEHALFGINHSGNITNRVGLTASDGLFFAVDGDGGTGTGTTLRDFSVFRGSNGIPFLMLTNTATFGPTAPLGPQFDNANPGFTNLFPPKTISGFGTTPAGSPGMGWVSVEVRQENNLITCLLNGTAIAQYTNTFAYTNGNILIGYNDHFSSIGDTNNFIIFDNVRVESVATATITLLSPRIVGNNFGFSFATEAYASYTVQRATDLTAQNWVSHTNIVGNGGTNEVLVPLLPQTNDVIQQFIRVSRP